MLGLVGGHFLAVASQLTDTHPTAATFCWLQAIPLLKESIKKAYGKKGDKIVNMNWAGELRRVGQGSRGSAVLLCSQHCLHACTTAPGHLSACCASPNPLLHLSLFNSRGQGAGAPGAH